MSFLSLRGTKQLRGCYFQRSVEHRNSSQKKIKSIVNECREMLPLLLYPSKHVVKDRNNQKFY